MYVLVQKKQKKLHRTMTMNDNLRVEVIDDNERGFGHVFQVYHFDRLIAEETDYGEPEDNSFTRDYAWIVKLVKTIYDAGYTDGLKGIFKI